MSFSIRKVIGVLLIACVLTSCGDYNFTKFKDSQSLSSFINREIAEIEDSGVLSDSYRSKISVEEIWSKRIGKGAENLYLKLTPAVIGGYLFVADQYGKLIATDISTGEPVWQIHDKNVNYTSGAGGGDGMVLIGTGDGRVIARDVQTGNLKWVAKVSSEILSAPTAFNQITVVRTGDGNIFGLDSGTGKEIWNYDRTVPSLTLRGNAPPVIGGDRVFAGFDNGRFVALDLKSGQSLWDSPLAIPSGRSDLDRMVDVDSAPIVQKNTIFVASFHGGVSAISSIDGRILWTREISSYAGIALGGRYVYVTDDEGSIWALNAETGASVWKKDELKERYPTAPAYYNGYVVVCDSEGYTLWMNAQTGEFVYKSRLDKSRIIARSLRAADSLISYSSNGRVVAMKLK
ncbi:MAG: outer membrane protein assembly factor BamB [Gammaproteobacteria bacterium]